MGVICGRLNRFEDAILYYKKALTRDTSSPYTFLNLAVVYKDLGFCETGIHYLTEGISHHPETGFLYYNRACFWATFLNQAFEQNGILDEDLLKNVLVDFQKSIALNEDFLPYGEKDDDLKLVLPYLYKNY